MTYLPYLQTIAAFLVSAFLGFEACGASVDHRRWLVYGYTGLAVISFAIAVVGFAAWPMWR
jgi:hypothetical protein